MIPKELYLPIAYVTCLFAVYTLVKVLRVIYPIKEETKSRKIEKKEDFFFLLQGLMVIPTAFFLYTKGLLA